MAAGALGLSWAGNWAMRPAAGPPGGLAGWEEPVGWLSSHYRIAIRNSFSFSKSFYNLQTNLNPIQIQISMTSTLLLFPM
jgi:hypothetical protein